MNDTAVKLAKLVESAKTASHRAYAPYSRFVVGAALWSEQGLFFGCNIENVSYGLSICAERVAMFNAISNAATNIELLVVYTPTSSPTLPCGACRQVLVEFARNALVLCVCDSEQSIQKQVFDLLPHAFEPANLLGSGPESGPDSRSSKI